MPLRFHLYRPFGPSVAAAVSTSLVAIIVLPSWGREPLSSLRLVLASYQLEPASCQLVPASCQLVLASYRLEPVSSPLADCLACPFPIALV